LTAHRALAAVLQRSDNGQNIPKGAQKKSLARKVMKDDRVLEESELVDLGAHCSTTEVEAESAERELRDFLVMQFLLEQHIGAEFPGVVTGITGGGVFVSIEKFLVEGMVKTADLPQSGDRPDRWRINEATGRLHAARSGATIGIGDIVTVQIANVILAARQLDLLMTNLPVPSSPPDGRGDGEPRRGDRKSKGKSKHQKNRKAERRGKSKRR
jgi:ribonuclease R